MANSDIDNIVIFKKHLGLNFEIDQKYVGLKMKENKILVFNFSVPENILEEIENYFSKFKMQEPIKVDIGNTGDISCYFKGTSPVTSSANGKEKVYHIAVILQELEKIPPSEEEVCETCSNCGFH